MVSLLHGRVGALVKSIAGLSCPQTRCIRFSGALSAMQCMTAKWFSKDVTPPAFPEEPPKRPLPAFFRFTNEMRPVLLKQNPTQSFLELSKMLGKEWKELPADEKQKYVVASRDEYMKFKQKYEEYRKHIYPLDLDILRSKTQKKLKKEMASLKRERMSLGMPKKCGNSFTMFVCERYQDIKGVPFSQRLKILAEEWKHLPQEKKQLFAQLAEDDKVRYRNEMKAWEAHMIEIGREDLIPKQPLKVNLTKMKTEPGKKTAHPAERRKRKPKEHEE